MKICAIFAKKINIGYTRTIPKFFTKFRHVFLTILTSKSDSTRISVEIFISKFHPNFASEYRKKCGPHSTRFQCRRHYVADIFCQKMSPKMSPTFKKCRRHLRRHFRRNYQNIGWVHRCSCVCKQTGTCVSVEGVWVCFKGEASAPTGVYGAAAV